MKKRTGNGDSVSGVGCRVSRVPRRSVFAKPGACPAVNLFYCGVLLAAVMLAGTARVEGASWWNSEYKNSRQITVTAAADALDAAYSVRLTVDHAALVATNKSLANGNDIRVVYRNGGAYVELDRVLEYGSAWNNSSTKIWFKLQAGIAASASNDNYYLYYNNASAGTPPANGEGVYQFWDDFPGTELDTGKWDVMNSGAGALTVSGGQINITNPVGVQWWGTSDSSRSIVSKTAFTGNYVADAYVTVFEQPSYAHSFGLRSSADNNAKMIAFQRHGTGSTALGYRWRTDIGGGASFEHRIAYPGANRVARFVRNGATVDCYYDGASVGTLTISDLDHVAFTGAGGDLPGDASCDAILLRKYVASDASIGISAGAEQKPPPKGTVIVIR